MLIYSSQLFKPTYYHFAIAPSLGVVNMENQLDYKIELRHDTAFTL